MAMILLCSAPEKPALWLIFWPIWQAKVRRLNLVLAPGAVPCRLPRSEILVAFSHGPGHWGMNEYDVVSQNFTSHHSTIRNGVAHHNSVRFCYV
jgi:hypothetical protein